VIVAIERAPAWFLRARGGVSRAAPLTVVARVAPLGRAGATLAAMSDDSRTARRSLGVRLSLGELLTFKRAAARNCMSLGEFLRTAGRDAAADLLEPDEQTPPQQRTKPRRPAARPRRRP
jgi:hypothetical protein